MSRKQLQCKVVAVHCGRHHPVQGGSIGQLSRVQHGARKLVAAVGGLFQQRIGRAGIGSPLRGIRIAVFIQPALLLAATPIKWIIVLGFHSIAILRNTRKQHARAVGRP
ncbi:hypothetical protein D7U95_12760 [Stenotrophomonas maltophilia]|nr:hypothetical protein [Stenotrophomonas maltophilia]